MSKNCSLNRDVECPSVGTIFAHIASGQPWRFAQQGLDTTTPAGKAMFQMLGVFAEFERSIIQERVRAGLQRAKREGKRPGRPPIADKLAERIRAALAGGMSVRKTAAKFDVNPSTVQRVAHPFEGADNASVAGAA